MSDQRLRIRSAVAAVALAAMALAGPRAATGAAAATSAALWFAPSPGSSDYLQLFEDPQAWARARELISVFKFYQQHTQTPPPSIVGPNSYDALARAGAFRLLGQWKKKIAVEAGSVKEFYCTPDASGMNASIAGTLNTLRAVAAAGGTVSYIAQDEPFVAGRARVCGGPALAPTADRVATYVAGVHAQFPAVDIGLIEAYPFSSADQIETEVSLLQARGAMPAFLHMDVDWHLSGRTAFVRDMVRLQAFAAAQRMPFGIIIIGYNGNSDPLYAIDAYAMTELIADTFRTWDDMPDHLIVQSWAAADSGLVMTPANLDEERPYSHTLILRDAYRRLRGGTGPSTGTAIPKTR